VFLDFKREYFSEALERDVWAEEREDFNEVISDSRTAVLLFWGLGEEEVGGSLSESDVSSLIIL
jgi:hypothetical protein